MTVTHFSKIIPHRKVLFEMVLEILCQETITHLSKIITHRKALFEQALEILYQERVEVLQVALRCHEHLDQVFAHERVAKAATGVLVTLEEVAVAVLYPATRTHKCEMM